MRTRMFAVRTKVVDVVVHNTEKRNEVMMYMLEGHF
jgi:hypothetical protein